MECWEIYGWEVLCKSSALLLLSKKIFLWYPQSIGEHISEKIAGWVEVSFESCGLPDSALPHGAQCSATWYAIPRGFPIKPVILHRSHLTPDAGTLPCRIILKFPHLQYMYNFVEVSNSYLCYQDHPLYVVEICYPLFIRCTCHGALWIFRPDIFWILEDEDFCFWLIALRDFWKESSLLGVSGKLWHVICWGFGSPTSQPEVLAAETPAEVPVWDCDPLGRSKNPWRSSSLCDRN